LIELEPLADRCRADGWRICIRLNRIRTRRRWAYDSGIRSPPFIVPNVLIVPVNTVRGFDYGMDSDGWVLQ